MSRGLVFIFLFDWRFQLPHQFVILLNQFDCFIDEPHDFFLTKPRVVYLVRFLPVFAVDLQNDVVAAVVIGCKIYVLIFDIEIGIGIDEAPAINCGIGENEPALSAPPDRIVQYADNLAGAGPPLGDVLNGVVHDRTGNRFVIGMKYDSGIQEYAFSRNFINSFGQLSLPFFRHRHPLRQILVSVARWHSNGSDRHSRSRAPRAFFPEVHRLPSVGKRPGAV